MRARAKLAAVLSSGAVLLVGWQLGEPGGAEQTSETAPVDVGSATAAPTTGDGTTDGTTDGTDNGTTSTTAPEDPAATPVPDTSGSSSASSSSSSSDGTFTGDSVSTRFGDVQVSVTIAGGAITDVTALHLTDKESRSAQISARAAPILREEVLAAQSADVANVSGATYTSDAYLQSLQSALAQAGR